MTIMMKMTRDQTKKRKWKFTSALEKAKKETRLYFQTCRFVGHYYSTCNQEERKVLDVVRKNLDDIYRNHYNKLFYPPKPNKTSYNINFNEDDVSALVFETRSLFQVQLDYLFQNMLNLQTKQEIKDFILDFKRGDITKYAHIWDYLYRGILRSHIYANKPNGQTKNKTPPQLDELQQQQQNNAQQKHTLHLQKLSSGLVDCNVSVIIQEYRSKVEKEINYVCNQVSNVAIQEAYRRHLADFQTGPKPKDPPSQIHHPHLQDQDCNFMLPLPICTPLGDEPKLIYDVTEQEIHHPHLQDKDDHLMSSKPDTSSGEGSSNPLPISDGELYYQSHEKCCRKPYWAKPEPIFKAVKWIGEEDGC